MTLTNGEIAALSVVVGVLCAGTVIICFRCWQSIIKAQKEYATNLQHTQDRGFHVSYVDTLRRSFRSLSFRKKQDETKQSVVSPVNIPRVHVASVDVLINEKSEIHPSYLDKTGEARKEFRREETSPFESQASYRRFDNENDDDEGCVDILKFREQKDVDFQGIENPNYSASQEDISIKVDNAEDGSAVSESQINPTSDDKPPSKHLEDSSSNKCKQSFPSAHYSQQMPDVTLTNPSGFNPSFPSAHIDDQTSAKIPGFEKLSFQFDRLSDEEIAAYKGSFDDSKIHSDS